MITRKQYKYSGIVNHVRIYEENSMGRNLGIQKIDQFGNTHKCVICRIDKIDLDNGTVLIILADFTMSNGTQEWIQKPDIAVEINDINYVYGNEQDSNFKQRELIPFEKDVNKPIDGTDPVEYENKLKDGLISEMQFFYNDVFLGLYSSFTTSDILFQKILEVKGWTI